MSTSTTQDNTFDFDLGAMFQRSDNSALARSVLGYTLALLAWGAAAAIAWSFTGFWAVMLMYVILHFVFGLLSLLANFVAQMFISDATFESVGASLFAAKNKVFGLFGSKK